ncbi:phospholipase A2 inhibitor and Ly6/PLAUR domain-containing protein-like [Elgaria multicarinata webbii]|uniref:phospholipase A2 inhibitor and Ly6/PLAUR domain-containing protein-like n=1 Tax=Elgaria multicarinata webbii TaxID=159646 RepID=UPI002FCCF2F6
MTGLLSLFLIAELLTTGTSLECETCFATNRSCEGLMETCEDNQDTCAISLTETAKGGKTEPTVAKGCYSSNMCEAGLISVTFGKGEFIRQSVICCQRDNCTSASPRLPLLNTTANGKRCPSCYSRSKACPRKMVNCTGAENYCMDVIGHRYSEKAISLKGCTTETMCIGLQAGKWDVPDIGTDVMKIDCRLASQAPPPLSESLLLVLSGMLLMKVL